MKKWAGVECIKTIGGVDVPTFKCLEAIYILILKNSVTLAVLALFVMLTVGGFKFLTSGGDPKATAGAKNTMTYAIGGLLILVLAFLIFRIIEVFTGVTITVFEIPVFD